VVKQIKAALANIVVKGTVLPSRRREAISHPPTPTLPGSVCVC